LVQSVVLGNVQDFVAEHDSRFVGLDVLEYATWIHPTHSSVGHVIFNVTHVTFVYVASELILNDQFIGAVVSYIYVHVDDML
jgi:hypothetical protein